MENELDDLMSDSFDGDPRATDKLFSAVYQELRKIAHANRRRWVGNDTLATTALINEAYTRLQGKTQWQSRAHFYATAAKAMRQILINYAEQRKADKRNNGEADLPFDDILLVTDNAIEEALSLHKALLTLEAEKPRWCQVFECRFFAGLSIDETAEALEISPATVSREWQLVSAWLCKMLESS